MAPVPAVHLHKIGPHMRGNRKVNLVVLSSNLEIVLKISRKKNCDKVVGHGPA